LLHVSSTKSNVDNCNIGFISILIAITFAGGKFVLGASTHTQEEPWKKFLIPTAKTDRLKYFNSLTKEVYDSAYTSKQSRFQSYLDGQRRFWWEIISNMSTELRRSLVRRRYYPERKH
jgi:hypothetical protein